MTSIDQLQIGDRAIVAGFKDTAGLYRRKLLSLGFTPGIEFSLTRIAPLGDPVEIKLRGFKLSLRRDEMSAIVLEKI